MNHLVAFSLGPVDVYRYGIMYFVWFVLGYLLLWYGQRQGRYRGTSADIVIKDDLDWLILAILIWVMVGGRLGHVFIYDFAYFVDHPLKIFAFQDGGMSFIGWIVGVALALAIYLYYFSPIKYTPQKDIFSLLDAMIPIVPLGIFFGRLGNFLNQELYGVLVSDLWRFSPGFIARMTDWRVFYRYAWVDNLLRVNTNLLAMIFEGALLAVVMWVLFFTKTLPRKRQSWQLALVFLACYSFVRFFLEYLRQDSQAEFVGIFTRSQWFFVVFFVLAVVGFIVRSLERSHVSSAHTTEQK